MIAALLGLAIALAVLVSAGVVAAARLRDSVRELEVEADTFQPPDAPRR